jgi:hypothetical protein
MNRFTFSILCITFCATSYSQTSLNSGGRYFKNSSNSISFSLGQLNFQTITNIGASQIQGVQQPFEINELSLKSKDSQKISVKLFPNPTSDIIVIIIEDRRDIEYIGSLLDHTGRKLTGVQINNNNATINMTQLPKGLYILKILSINKESSFQILKK